MNGNALSPAAARDVRRSEGKDHDRDFTHVYRTTPVTPRLHKLIAGAWIVVCCSSSSKTRGSCAILLK